jgi:diguanylate cyclase (GGDEF)-like protein
MGLTSAVRDRPADAPRRTPKAWRAAVLALTMGVLGVVFAGRAEPPFVALFGVQWAWAHSTPADPVLDRKGLSPQWAMGPSALAEPIAAPADAGWLQNPHLSSLSGPLSAGFAALSCFFAILYVRRMRRALAESRSETWRVAHSDPVSGIANRLFFLEALEGQMQPSSGSARGKLAVLIVAVDRFKQINDTFGHAGGDRTIAILAERFGKCLGEGDTLARLTGAEFGILQPQTSARGSAETLAKKLLEAAQQPIAIDERQVELTVSIGIALYPEHAESRDEALCAAHMAQRRAREEGRNRYVCFDKAMREDLRVRKTFDEEMRNAMKSDALVLHYQPLWSVDGKHVVGVEAMVAWQDADKGPVGADQLARFAEEVGLALQMREWILRRAALDVLQWPNLRVAVNVASAQFRHAGFLAQVERILRETGLEPARLQLELSEKMVVANAAAAEGAINGLRAQGVCTVLDDFGTGSSSLIFLSRFALDKVKIDKSFFEAMGRPGENTTVVHAAVHLARALGLTVTADGVATTAQHRFLQAVGCHEVQGSLFGSPMPAAEIDQLIALETDLTERPPPPPERLRA